MNKVRAFGKYLNPFLVELVSIFSIVMELCDGGDVFQKICNHKK